jgi:octopine/nopaline transport system substrate-binding protein
MPARRRRAVAIALAVLAIGLYAAVAAADTGSTTIRIAMRDPAASPPESAAAIGFEAELAKDLCTRMAANCEIVSGKGDASVAALLARRADALMAWLPVTQASKQAIDFSAAYVLERHGLAVPDPGPLADLPGTGKVLSLTATPQDAQAAIVTLRGALAGNTVGALAGSADLAFLQSQFADVRTQAYPTAEAMMRDLAAGRLDAVMGSAAWLQAMLALPVEKRLALSGPQFAEDERFGFGIAAGFRKSDPALRNQFDRAISTAMGDGTLERLSLKWFKTDLAPKRCFCKPF